MTSIIFSDELPVTSLKGVGNKVAENLSRLGISSVADVLFHLPYRYEDRSKIIPIGALQPSQSALFEGRVELAEVVFRGRRSLLVRLSDDTGFITLRFFHFSMNQKNAMIRGSWLRCFGDIRASKAAGGLEVAHPEYRQISEAQRGEVSEGLLPVYPVTEGLRQASLRKLAIQALLSLNNGVQLQDYLPEFVLQKNQWPAMTDSLHQLHHPQSEPMDEAAMALEKQPAFQRLVFEELLAHHLSLSRLKKGIKKNSSFVFQRDRLLESKFSELLSFQLTAAQQKVTTEIYTDLARDQPMQRLLQGDVGSGKTVVSAFAALMAYASGYQVALMAPTELLAEQHFNTLSEWFEPLGINVGWLTGKHKGEAYRKITEQIQDGSLQLIVGTHALFQDKVVFNKLGLVIIDEQHRFGVHQRMALRNKGINNGGFPHQLVMTATPIPRTLALLGYADLDLSVIDALPVGRMPVITSVIPVEKRGLVISRIQQGVIEGRQVYWVCTLIEESEVLQCQAAEVAAELLQSSLPEVRIGLVHGRMKSQEKQQIMRAYKNKELDVLVATTVIEVGVDVPNASLMVIENAERLGLAQLHQLRGRVGRGSQQSHCVLMYKAPLSKNANERLGILRQTNDGFKIAEKDMQLRGPGEMLGKRQAGFMRFKIADMQRDEGMFAQVAETASLMLQDYPQSIEPLIRRWLGNSVEYADI